ncbi:protein dopey-1 isoform X3 [Octopus sinensis]|uniref:Protein dopey-1 isoform X3 n=1 Tax=Octopus sinensis TaxID=2607531 RepID=A0A6P7SEJ4_9MOLL|nr:protein dopey-1 isoform X3 [Octopus sinensis]
MSMLTVEECELLGDSKYRSYISQVEKALKYFETTSEWADLISALGKLNKVLLSHMKYPVIPKRVIIGKRLAQCLHPALPSGVHLKALETYDIIFKSIGLERLSQDLFIYTAGLFPLMSYAAMNVKPVLLDLYECHFVPLGKHIKPGLNGLLLGLLPGMEEGSELSYRCDKLLVDFSQVTDESYFYSCMWQCIYTFPAARLQAITFLLTHYNKKQSMEDQLYMMGLNIDLMVQAACTAVQDSIVLVQRSLLDFLLIAFPMHNAQLTKADMLKILKASVTVILRRDMSLNRRLYAWLLGTDCNGVPLAGAIDARQRHSTMSNDSVENNTASSEGEKDQSYFHTFSKDLLVLALKARLYESSCTPDNPNDESSAKASILQPFRILISLLDKPEIGPVILENVLWAIFRSLYKECKVPSSNSKTASPQRDEKVITELLKTANLLFNSFEPFYIWDFIGRMFELACQKSSMQVQTAKVNHSDLESSSDMPDFIELCELCNFLLDVISLETYLETQTEFLPNLLRRMITSLIHCSDKLHSNQIMYSLKLCDKILTRAQPSMTVIETGDQEEVVNNVFSVDNYSNERQKSESSASSTSEDLTIESTDSGALNDFETLSSPQILKCDTESVTQNSQIEMTERTPINHVANLRATFYRMTNSPIKSADKIVSAPLTLMQACVQCFQDFFHTFVSHRIFNEDTSVNNLLDSITLPVDSIRCSDKDSVIGSSSSVYSQDETLRKQSMESRLPQKISVKSDSDFCEAFTWACRLLVEFASFPIYCTDYHKILEQSFQQEEDSALPPWLQDLILCSCFVDNFHIQVAAISTMLDLVSLTQSVECESRSKDDGGSERKPSSGNDGGTISVVILPALLPRHLKYLNNNTLFYQMVAQNLWNHLDASTSNNHQRSVELFQQLHQVTPNSWVCEDVIGSALVGDEPNKRIEAFRKFTVLWHLIRDKKTSRAPGMPLRTFDRSMFAVLDSLREDTSSAKTLASTWLMHTIQRGGIYRILEPTLLILLHPDTARISIQHVNIHQPQKVKLSDVDEDKSDTKIFAISSEGGNVIYHVSSKTKNISKKNVEELKSFALTVMNEKGSGVLTASTRAQIDMPFDRVNPENLKLRINPFGGSENSLDRLIFDGFELPPPAQNFDLRSIRRLTKETCLKEGIYFDEKDQLDNTDPIEDQTTGVKQELAGTVTDDPSNNVVTVEEPAGETSENIVTGILDDLVNKVTREPLLLSKQVDIPDDFSLPDGKSGSMSKDSSVLDDEDLLNAIDKRGLEIDSPTGSESDLSRPFGRSSNNISNNLDENEEEATGIHTLHMHILLYVQKYDCQQTLYALSTLKSMLVTCPRLMVTAMATTSISNNRLQQLPKLQMLLARHRKSVFGNNFFGELPSDVISNYRTNMYLEIVISLCLYFIRSYYPNLMMSKLSLEELHGNKEVHILSAEILTHLVSELIHIMKESGKSFVSYISDLLMKCKLQKAILHSVLASVYNSRQISDSVMHRVSFTETIISFNEDSLEQSANETFQIKLLNLLLVMIMLEGHIQLIKGSPNQTSGDSANNDNTSSSVDWDRTKVNFNPSLSRVRYNSGRPIVQQGMFLSAVLSALKQSHRAHMHRHWISMVTAALPHMGKAMALVVMNVVSQLCRNLESISSLYTTPKDERKQQMKSLPPDHVLTMLEGLTRICHYCLLDNSSPVLINQHSLPNLGIQSAVDSYTAGQILTNLIHVFNPVSGSREANSQSDAALLVPLLEARTHLLSILPRIIGCMATLWKAINESEENLALQHNWIIGAPKVVRSYILEFLSPVAVPHGCNLLGSVAVAWNDRRRKVPGYNKKVIPVPCEDQLLLVQLVDAIKVLPTDTLVQTVKQVLKQPPPCDLGQTKKSVSLEINMLQFFYAYIQQASVQQLLDSKQSLLSLLKEGQALNLSPPGLFLLLEILNEFVQRIPSMEDRKSQKDIQDIAQKLVEAVSTVAGLCLEQTTWLRRNLAVKPGPQTDILETEEGEATEESDVELANMAERKVIEPQLYSNTDVKYCVQALTILAELTAPLLDVVYGSDEKERIASFLTSIMYNVFPYLRNHSGHNIPSFRAASQLLSSISGYQYTRKAWRKEAFDLLMDPSFFQMDLKCLCHWSIVIDNLMTHDKTTFKDLMSRVAITQSGSLNLFSSKEQEFELRAQMLKRLSFTILSSESDQYQRNMPDIQERLAECLRTPQVPSVMSQVFLCFRVLILRMSPLQLTSLWPIIITEMVNVFLQIEQELSTDTDEFRAQLQRIAALESSWAHLGNGLNAHNNPIWLQLYLSVCKLLDMALILPADIIPQFQLYKWAFTGGPSIEDDHHEDPKQNPKIKSFVCHVTRISKLLNSRIQGEPSSLKVVQGQPLLNMSHIRSLMELQPFFNALYQESKGSKSTSPSSLIPSETLLTPRSFIPKSRSAPEFDYRTTVNSEILPSSNFCPLNNQQVIEEYVKKDFLEFFPPS